MLPHEGLTLTHRLRVCTRVELVANIVISTFCDLTDVDEVRVSTELPLARDEELNPAPTPVGRPFTDNCTGPKSNDFNCSGIAILPPLMEYDGR